MAQSGPEETVRIGLVLNGGVSLAVWMGGVTHEIDRLIHTRPPSAEDRVDLLAASATAWDRILTAAGKRVIVDYIAGTSAGGLNGTMLATAIARGVRLPALKKLWYEKARLNSRALLSRDPHGSRRDHGLSVFNGDYFQRAIADEVGRVVTAGENPTRERQAVTLLVTATATAGGRLSVDDAADQPLNVSDHRHVYRFKLGPNGRDDFRRPDTLALAARASASLPGAFAPVRETEDLQHLRVGGPPAALPADLAAAPSATWLIDGGVLDNAPFKPLMEEIIDSPRPDTGQRWIVYVVPSTTPRSHDAAESTGDPSWWSLLGRLPGIKGEIDLRTSVERLEAMEREGQAAVHRPEQLIDTDLEVPDQYFTLYRHTRAHGFAVFVKETSENRNKLRAERIAQEEIRAAQTAISIPTALAPGPNDDDWAWGITAARRMILSISRHARSNRAPLDTVKTIALHEYNLQKIEQQVTRIHVAHNTSNVSARVTRTTPQLIPLMRRIRTEMDAAVRVWATFTGLDTKRAYTRILHAEVMAYYSTWRPEIRPPLFDVFLVHPGSDTSAVALGLQSGNDSTGFTPELKLYGTRLAHFGAFGHESYRNHDWLWGRIDGAMCLASALLREVPDQDHLKGELIGEILAEEGVTAERFVRQTRCLLTKTDRELFDEAVRHGELELPDLVAAVERALLAWHRHNPDNRLAHVASLAARTVPWPALARFYVGRVHTKARIEAEADERVSPSASARRSGVPSPARVRASLLPTRFARLSP